MQQQQQRPNPNPESTPNLDPTPVMTLAPKPLFLLRDPSNVLDQKVWVKVADAFSLRLQQRADGVSELKEVQSMSTEWEGKWKVLENVNVKKATDALIWSHICLYWIEAEQEKAVKVEMETAM
jgi:hypothetical protein